MTTTRQLVWNGKVLIHIKVYEPISIGTQEYLLVASRVSYLLLYLERVLAYFEKYLDNTKTGDWWFEYDGLPVSFNQPIGLLHDLLVGYPTSHPWHLTLKRGKYPTSTILQFDAENSIQSYWTNQFKESCYIRDGNSKSVMLLPRGKHEMLWWSIKHSADLNESNSAKSFDSFWQTTASLLKKPSSIWNVPIRFHMVISKGITGTSVLSTRVVQNIVRSDQTIGDALALATQEECIPLLHGIAIHRDAPLGLLYTECLYPDGFLHVAVVRPDRL